MGGRRLAALGAAAAFAIAGNIGTGARAQAPSLTAGAATLGPLISGTSSYVDGTFVWTDYAYDDRGPDTNSTAGGDATYPATMNPNNVADIIQLQLALPDPSHLAVTAVLETLTDTTLPLIGVATDSDNDASTGAPALPGSWTAASSLGVDRLLLLGRDGGHELLWNGSAWVPGRDFAVALDPADNTVRAVVPFAAPGAGTLRAVAAAGYDDAAGGSWATGSSPVHDLAFVVDDVPVVSFEQAVVDAITGFASNGERQWQEDNQSAILGGKGDATAAVASIDVGAMQARATSLPDVATKGFSTFLYKSALQLGEGVSGSGNSAVYLGPYQPYRVWVPGAAPGTADPYRGLPLVLYLHGSSQTHTSAVNTDPYNAGGVFSDFSAVVAWPLGRGPQTWYDGAALVDPLDVADDVVARLSLDPERVMLAGLSMGGYGTFKLGELYPDRWSVAYVDAAADDTGMPENLTALGIRMQNGVADPLIPLSELAESRPLPPFGTRALLDGAATVDYRSYYVVKETHAPATALAKCIYVASFSHPRVQNPARVRYTIDPSRFIDDPATGLHLRWDGAYWVSGMTAAGAGKGSVDLTTDALGSVPVPGATFTAAHENLTAGTDFCGPNPAVQTQDIWTEQGRAMADVPHAVERALHGTVTGLSALTIAADRAGLGGRDAATMMITAESPASLTITGLPRGVAVTIGTMTLHTGSSGRVTVPLAAGDNAITW
jgi:pimeloyl-ACP methyl ester carboxylesterase